MPDSSTLAANLESEDKTLRPGTSPRFTSRLKKVASGRALELLGVFLVRGLGAVSLFILYFVAARRMSQTEAGMFFLGLTWSTVLAPIALFGMHTIALRELSARSDESQQGEIRYLLGQTLVRGAVLALGPALLLYFLAPWLATSVFQKPSLDRVLQFSAIAGFAGSLSTLMSGQLQGLRRFSQSLMILSIATPLMASALLTWRADGLDAAGASALYAQASWMTAALGGFAIWLQCPSGTSTQVTIDRLASSCFSLWIINTMIMAVNWSGQLIAGAYLPASDVALLAVSQRTANLVNFILIGVNFVVTPRFSAFWANHNLEGIRRLALDSTRAMSLIAIPLVIAIACMPGQIMSWFGKDFAGGGTLLLILSVGQLFNVMTGSVNALLNMCGFDRDLRNIVILSGSLTIGLSWLFTRLFGASGCALAITIALVVQNGLAVHMVKKRLGFSMFEALFPARRTIQESSLSHEPNT